MNNPAFDSTTVTTASPNGTTNTPTSDDPQLITRDPGMCANCNKQCGGCLKCCRCMAPFMICAGFLLIPACVFVLFIIPNFIDDGDRDDHDFG